MDNMTFETDL
jgi:4a-hydroxytetrahydrobiopterin dehydratase